MQAALDKEWAQCFAGTAAPVPRTWRVDPRLAWFSWAAQALAELDADDTSPERVEELARALAEAAAAGDTLAARVLLQHIVPQLAALAWGSWMRGGQWVRQSKVPDAERQDTFDAMVSTVWLSLVTGDALRGAVGVRRRLFRDAEYRVLQRPRRRAGRERAAVGMWRQSLCAVADIEGRAETAERSAGEELLEVVSDALDRGLGLRDAQVIADLGFASNARLAVHAVTEAAQADPDGVTTRCVRYRRAAALRRVADLRSEAA